MTGPVRIPVSSKGAAVASATLYAPVKRVTSFLQALALIYLRTFGPHWFPGRAQRWETPVPNDVWNKFASEWATYIGAFDSFAVLERRQRSREGFGLLLLSGQSPVAFVRVNKKRDDRFEREFKALDLIHRSLVASFMAPRPLAKGYAGEWAYLATSAMLPGRHSAAMAAPIKQIAAEIQRALVNTTRPDGIADHWVPMHGDLTPWNLRRAPGPGLYLFDWEHVGWAPPGADEVMYLATLSLLDGRKEALTCWPEARGFWVERLRQAQSGDVRARQRREALIRILGS
jgi:hypothetical protein